jgi:hypothetical protein
MKLESPHHGWLALAVIVGIYLALAIPTLGRQGAQWDEQSDLEIAESYFVSRGAFLNGSPVDLVNVRLPMFSVAALQLVGAPLDIATARLVSTMVGALALVGLFVFARLEFDVRRGLIAVILMGLNPYFLAYAPLAFTEGDSLITCAVAWSMAAYAWLWQRPTRVRALAAGVSLGLALSSKISALALLPAMVLGTWLRHERRPGALELRSQAIRWIPVAMILLTFILLPAIATQSFLPDWRVQIPGLLRVPFVRFMLILAFLLSCAVWGLRRPSTRIDFATASFMPIAVAVATFFVVPPSHTGNGRIFSSLWRQFLGAGGDFDPSRLIEVAVLHLAVLWIKPSLGIGTALIAGVVIAMRYWPSILLIASYGGFLLLLPWGQIRYAMPLLPPMAILASDALISGFDRRPRLISAVATAMLGLCLLDFALCYPDSNLNGYQWLGTRYWGGRSTLGYRSIGQVGSDGLEQCTRWVSERAAAGDTVVTYSNARHIVERARGDTSPANWIDGLRNPDAILEADWVVTHLNDDIDAGYTGGDPSGEVFKFPLYDRGYLISRFEKAYSVERRFGVEAGAVWRRL